MHGKSLSTTAIDIGAHKWMDGGQDFMVFAR